MGRTNNRQANSPASTRQAGPSVRHIDEHLAAAVELNYAEWLRLEGTLPWVQFHDDEDAQWLFAGDAWPRNSVALARFTPETAHRRVGEILAPRLRSKVACNWVVGPLSQPSYLAKHLRVHGFRCMIRSLGMACNLSQLPPWPAPPDGVTVGLVGPAPSLQPLTTQRRWLRRE